MNVFSLVTLVGFYLFIPICYFSALAATNVIGARLPLLPDLYVKQSEWG